MKIIYYVRMLLFKHFEKLIACAATGLFAVSIVQSISKISLEKKPETYSSSADLNVSEYMAEANSRDITYEIVKSVARPDISSGKNREKEKTSLTLNTYAVTKAASSIRHIEKKTTSKAVRKNIAKAKDSKKKTHTYHKTGNKTIDRLNSVELKPEKFLKGKDEKILTKYLNKIIDDDMSNYEKAKECYDYIINNTYYSYGGWGNAIESVLENGFGTCTEYSYVYMAMMRYLGFDAKTVDGSTAMAAGGYGYHMWTEVKLNGKIYVFDPQVEDDMSDGKINYYRFCKTYSEVAGSYKK